MIQRSVSKVHKTSSLSDKMKEFEVCSDWWKKPEPDKLKENTRHLDS
jgi:hypothetical protein